MEEVGRFVRETNQKQKDALKKRSLNKCLITKDYEMNSLVFYYQGYSSLLIETTIYSVLAYDIRTFIGNQRLSKRLSVSKFTFGGKTYVKVTAI